MDPGDFECAFACVCSQGLAKVRSTALVLLTPSGVSELDYDPHECKIHNKLTPGVLCVP